MLFISQGSNATGDYCSKCFRQLDDRQQKKLAEKTPAPVAPAVVEPAETPSEPKLEAAPVEPEVKTPEKEVKAPSPTEEKVTQNTAAKVSKKKKKKKKASYKDMMAGMMKGDATNSRDIQKEKEDLRKVTGGGAFSKIEKI